MRCFVLDCSRVTGYIGREHLFEVRDTLARLKSLGKGIGFFAPWVAKMHRSFRYRLSLGLP
jgi:hypothetical protein